MRRYVFWNTGRWLYWAMVRMYRQNSPSRHPNSAFQSEDSLFVSFVPVFEHFDFLPVRRPEIMADVLRNEIEVVLEFLFPLCHIFSQLSKLVINFFSPSVNISPPLPHLPKLAHQQRDIRFRCRCIFIVSHVRIRSYQIGQREQIFSRRPRSKRGKRKMTKLHK